MVVLKIKECSVRMAQEMNVKVNEYVLRTSVHPCGVLLKEVWRVS